MGRLRVDVSGKAQFKPPITSSSGELYGQSQLLESGFGGGGGSRSAGRGGAASKTKLTTNDALSYLKEIKDTFPYQKKKYYMFLEVLSDFRNQRIDTAGIIARVKDLFKGHPSLLLGFNAFLPKGYEITLNNEDEVPPKETVDFVEAINLVNNIKKRFENNDHVYKSFLDILNVYRRNHKDINEVYYEVAVLLTDHPDLLDEFTRFMPHSHTVDMLSTEQKTRAEIENMDRKTHDEASKKSDIENKGDLSKQHDSHNMKSVRKVEEFGGPQEDKYALKCTYSKGLTFCEKVKETLGSLADYQTFIKCLRIYSRKMITTKQLRSLVSHTLEKYPGLMEDFNKFIKRYKRVVGYFVGVMTNSKCKTEAPSIYQIEEENEVRPPRSKLEEAHSLVKKIKERLQNDDGMYQSLLDILEMYRKKQKNFCEVYHEVVMLLNDHQDLIDDFKKFLPDSSAIAMIDHYVDQLTILFSSL